MLKYFKACTKESEESLKKFFNKNHDIRNYIYNYTLESFYYKKLENMD